MACEANWKGATGNHIQGRVGHDHVEAFLVLHVGQVLRQRVGMNDVRRVDPVQDHVHRGDDVGEALLLLAVEGSRLQRLKLAGGQLALAEIVVRLA
jgi:hypothetical protein